MSDFLTSLAAIVGAPYVLTSPEATLPFFRDYGGRFQGRGLAVAKPASTEEVAAIVRLCNAFQIAVVPQGGNTGLVGGSVPYQDNAIVLSLSRLNKFRSIDADNFTMTVEAGCILEQIQQAARDAGRYFPLALGAQGSCQIGGNIATNAGGILTIRYGNCRDLVLGLEVVLPSGEIWNGLRSLRKDNTGYNLKHLFIGSEGTLGIVTAAVLKLFPDPGLRETFFVATESLENVVAFLPVLRDAFGENLLAYEVLSRCALDCALEYNKSGIEPLATRTDWTLLIEICGSSESGALRQQVEDVLALGFEKELLSDATIAQNEEQARQFWTIRESVSDAVQARPGRSIKHDIAVPIAAMPGFVRDAVAAARLILPNVEAAIFGHAGDGNLHFDLVKGEAMPVEEYLSQWKQVNHAVHDVVQNYNGSIAAEHGIGFSKVGEMAQRKSPVEMELMRKIKAALDPDHLMNPGKVLQRTDI
ncbi:MAG: putative glycolate oxidase subunit GlcD [Alphaproteobacteria bacterium]|nr:putative glycolate oxidase subunit GlcD [Alphaproteobacteria bacterium]